MFSGKSKETASMISTVWIGLILGVSFYAAPIKFTSGVELEQLLAVGQVTFQGFTWIELAAFLLLLLTSLRRGARRVTLYLVVLGILLLVQKMIILPILDTALDQTVAGEPMGESNLHFVYGVIDFAKIVVLFLLARLLRSGADSREPAGALA
jgi:hypothetical protein